MKTLLLTFLSMGFRLVLFTHSVASDKGVYCKFAGVVGIYNYVFNITGVQNELRICGVFVYGYYFFDVDPPTSTANTNAIHALVGTGKDVYVGIQYVDDYREWIELLDPTDNDPIFNTKVNNLVTYLRNSQISGVIMQGLLLYQPESPATAQNIAAFATKLKEKMNYNLKVGLRIGAYDYQQFKNKTALDYEVTNNVIDHYFIDLTGSNYCSNTTKHDTVNPIRSTNSALLTLEEQSIGVKASAMEKSKVVAELQVDTILSIQYYKPQYEGEMKYGSYSELCAFTEKSDILQWCSDYTTTLYHQGKFATKYYRGIMLSVMEGDDTYGACHCGPFIVSKAIISGWKSETEPKCKKLDELMKIT